jgi:hypothetical protein
LGVLVQISELILKLEKWWRCSRKIFIFPCGQPERSKICAKTKFPNQKKLFIAIQSFAFGSKGTQKTTSHKKKNPKGL